MLYTYLYDIWSKDLVDARLIHLTGAIEYVSDEISSNEKLAQNGGWNFGKSDTDLLYNPITVTNALGQAFLYDKVRNRV